ncbi:MAG: adenosine deaminase, partial [Candidatus Marinimicrobia bacterium]|nr:adenosine deaminase [Candidatus Neomarinimicrobiota bacterium]
MRITHSLLQRLPKVELHCHLDGSLRLETILDLAQKDKVSLPGSNVEDLGKILVLGNTRGSLEDYLSRFDITLSVMQTPESLERCAYELIEDVAKENVRYIEIRYSPILHNQKDMTPADSIDAVRVGLKKAENDFGVKSGIIVCGIRNISAEVSLKLADLTVRYKNRGVVGFDLAGAEENFPAKDHR